MGLASGLPWYFEMRTALTRVGVSTQFWYMGLIQEVCSNIECDWSWNAEYWHFGAQPLVRAVFGVSWTLSVLSFFTALWLCVAPQAKAVNLLLVEISLAILVFFFITPALRHEGSCLYEHGPCSILLGFDSHGITNITWGPGTGYWFALIAWLISLVMCISVDLCICRRRRNPDLKALEEYDLLLPDESSAPTIQWE